MNLKQLCFAIAGTLSFSLGAIGAVLPILPTTPFLLVAACCFAKSSTRLNNWFIGTKLYQDNLASYAKGEGMPKKAKIRIITTVTLLMGFGFMMMSAVPVARVILAVVWVCHVLYFALFVKTV